jgi:CHAD domain
VCKRWDTPVKHHWYHVHLLQQTWPEVMHGYGKALKTLAELLGDDHDLTVFRQTLSSQPEVFGTDADIQVLLGLIEQHQTELRLRAKRLGQRIFAEKPSRFSHRMQRYMVAWQAESRPLPLTAALSPSE